MIEKEYPRICANCEYFEERCEDYGNCKRYPETVLFKSPLDWCGELKIRGGGSDEQTA